MHQIPQLECFSSRLAVAFAQYIEAKCSVENEDKVGAAPTGDAPTISEWSAIELPTIVPDIRDLMVNGLTHFLQGVLEFIYPDLRFHVKYPDREYDIFGHGGMVFWFVSSIFFSLVSLNIPERSLIYVVRTYRQFSVRL